MLIRSSRLPSLLLLLVVGHAGCGGGDLPSTDAGSDANTVRDGGGGDGDLPDGGPPAPDTGIDASIDAGSDAGSDGGIDAGNDAFVLPACSCALTAVGSTRGAAIALSADESTLVSVNRDSGSVTVSSVDWTTSDPTLAVQTEIDLGVGSEPWQVAIDACGECAYVVLRHDQRVVRIEGLDTATPTRGLDVAIGSEPTALALTPNNTRLYATNWVDGTVNEIDPVAMTITRTIDLNTTLASTGYLGPVTPRPALAHPRAIAITNDGDSDDTNERVLVTEWFAQRTAPESATLADTTHVGMVYRFDVSTGTPTTIELPAVADTGFPDHTGAVTGCYPNQLASITIDGAHAYVTSTCASPRGPLGVFQRGSCTTTANCTAFSPISTCNAAHLCTNSCALDSDCGVGAAAGSCQFPAGTCRPNTTDVRTTTHPALSSIDVGTGTATTQTLDTLFAAPAVASARMPLLPTDVAFTGTAAYLTAEGADAVFRISVGPSGAVSSVGSATNDFIDLRRPTGDSLIRLPIGIAASRTRPYAFVADDGSRDVTAIQLATQAIVGAGTGTFGILQASALPVAGSPQESALRGRRFFTTGLGRWSLAGAAWGACAACHIDGLTDNVTWYFARGPRQSTSLDGSFASSDPTDQRIFNWTAINDEVADFEGNVRGVSGGVGAIVSTVSTPPATTDRIDVAGQTPQQQGLQGSSAEIADPAGTSVHPHSVVADWNDIRRYIQSIRSPRGATGLVTADVDAGRALFASPASGNCVGCHSGSKWTLSRMFYTPGDVPNDVTGSAMPMSLSAISWFPATGFPVPLFPVGTPATSQRMRFGAPPAAEQMQCALRPVGTFAVSDPAINVLELRQDMTTAAQGNGATPAADPARGYNIPSLLGASVGGAYFHAGNARTLEEVFDARFVGHHQSAIASVFSPSAAQIRQLTAYLLSIDETTPPLIVPARGSQGGDLCFYP